MKKFFGEFKQFISKGNILDLAIAVVLGNAFNKIINSLVSSVIMPLIGLATGGASVAEWKWVIQPAVIKDGVVVVAENAVAYGLFLQAIIDFLIIALCLFLAVKIVNYSKNKIKKVNNSLQKNIKELTKHDKKTLKKQGVDVEKLEAENKDGKVADLIEQKAPETLPEVAVEPSKEEKLLTEIRDLLANNIQKTNKNNSKKEQTIKQEAK